MIIKKALLDALGSRVRGSDTTRLSFCDGRILIRLKPAIMTCEALF